MIIMISMIIMIIISVDYHAYHDYHLDNRRKYLWFNMFTYKDRSSL